MPECSTRSSTASCAPLAPAHAHRGRHGAARAARSISTVRARYCFLVAIPAMLPLYEKLGMDRRILACAVSLAAGVNFLPWTGPTIRASAALKSRR